MVQVPAGSKSTAALNTERAGGAILGFETQAEGVKGNFPPVDTNSQPGLAAGSSATLAGAVGDKDRPKFNKNAYMAVYMREVYRPRLKAKKEAAM